MPAWFRIASPSATDVTAHPTGQHRLSQSPGVGLELLGDVRGIGHPLRRHDDQQAVDIGIFRGDLKRLGVALGLGVAEDVDGIVVAPCGRQNRVEGVQGLRRKLGEFAAVLR